MATGKAIQGREPIEGDYLTLAECKRLLNAADPEFRLLARAALETGARYSHIAQLRVGDFNPDSGTLHIRPQSQPGKQGKGFHVVLTDEGQEFFAQLVAGRAGQRTTPRSGVEGKRTTAPDEGRMRAGED